MSGGTFDYRQYILEEITDTIEEIIRESEKEKPIKLKKLGIASYKIISDTCKASTGYYNSFPTIERAIGFYKEMGYEVLEDKVVDGLRYLIMEYKKGAHNYHKIDVHEYIYEEYADGKDYCEYSKETIEEFKKAVEVIKSANTYIHHIDYLLAGDIGEDSFNKRIKEDRALGIL